MKHATAKDEIRVILQKYLGRQEAESAAEEILAVMQETSRDATVEPSNVASSSKTISNPQKFDTIKVKGSDSADYKKLLNYSPGGEKQEEFQRMLSEAINSKVVVVDFEVPVCDPSMDAHGKLQFILGATPATGYSYNELEQIAKENGIRLGTKNEYMLFLATMILRLIAGSWSKDDAWYAVCVDSKELGHYWNSAGAMHQPELTGSRSIVGKCDLANTYKTLKKDEKAGGFWQAGGNYGNYGDDHPLADLNLEHYCDNHRSFSVGWFVL